MKSFLKYGSILILLFSVNGFVAMAQDADGDGVANTSDCDSDNDGITDNLECGANSSSMALNGTAIDRGDVTTTTPINTTGSGGYPVTTSFKDLGNYIDPITGLQTPFAEQGQRKVDFNVNGIIGSNDVYEGCEIRIKFKYFDDGIIVELNGVVLLDFAQPNYLPGVAYFNTGPFGRNQRFDSDRTNFGWWPGEGNTEMVITDGNIQVFADVHASFGGGREDILPYLNGAGLIINKAFTLDCTQPFDFSYTSVSRGGGGHSMGEADVSVNMFVCVDTDGDGLTDNIDNDSDGDGCDDVFEVGHSDSDGDGYLGTSPFTVDSLGKVVGQGGYTGTHVDVITIGPDLNNNGIPDACDTCTGPPIVMLGNDTNLCQGDSLILDATARKATYLWHDGSTTPTFKVIASGMYWVQVTDVCGVTNDTINVAINPVLTISLGNDTSLCQGETLNLDATNFNVTYAWNDGSVNPTLDVIGPGMYWVQISDECGIASDTIDVNYNSVATVDLGNDVIICQGQTLILNASTPNVSYVWQDNSTDSTFNVVAPGVYWVQISDSCGSTSDTINVDFHSTPIVDLGNDVTICQGQTLTLDASVTSVTYLWQDGSIGSTFNVVTQGTYWVQVSDSCGTTSDTIDVSVSVPVTVDLGNDTSLCQGQVLTLDANTPNVTYLWQDNSTSSTLNVNASGMYWVQITDSCGSSFDTIRVDFNPTFTTVDLGNDTVLCHGQTLTLDATNPNVTYLWQDNSSGPTLDVTQEGTYWVQINDSCGSIFDTISISYEPMPAVYLGSDATLCLEETIELDATFLNSSYLWQDNSTGATFNVEGEGLYWVEVTNSCGTASDTAMVNVEDCSCKFFIPNTFTPNNDNDNDLFSPKFDCDMTDYSFVIFDRWGGLVFETNMLKSAWDGNYKGIMAQTGVYVYLIKYKHEGKAKKISGRVSLLK